MENLLGRERLHRYSRPVAGSSLSPPRSILLLPNQDKDPELTRSPPSPPIPTYSHATGNVGTQSPFSSWGIEGKEGLAL